MKAPLAIGVDIGGTHITCAAVELTEGNLLPGTLYREAYDHKASADIVLHSWANALNHTLLRLDEQPLAGIGFAMPGPFDYRNGISKMLHKFPLLYDLHISEALNPLLVTDHTLSMRFLNDATCFAIGEAWQGTGKHYRKVVVITLGTGFGSAFLEEEIPVVSGEAVPQDGCLWHLPFREGIADDYFSTRWFKNEYHKQTGEEISGVQELMQKVDNDAFVRSLFTRFGQNLAECLAPWLRNFRAEILIIGGNIARALRLFIPDFRKSLWAVDVFLPVVPSLLMENAALIGSARLMDDAFWDQVSMHLPRI